MKSAIIFCVLIFLTGCATGDYQRTKPPYLDGYWDEEIEPGVYIVEVYTVGGYKDTRVRSEDYFHRRAKELCPGGYESGYYFVFASDVYFEEFRCYARFCQNYPQLTGQVTCK